MEQDTLNTIRALLELGWPALAIMFIIVLWRRVVALEDKCITMMQELHQRHHADKNVD
jgi:hypothetical protein